MAPTPSATTNRTGIRIHARRRIDWIFIKHHWRRYNDRPANHDRGSQVLENGGRRRSVRLWYFAIERYRQIGGHCRRSESYCTGRTQDRLSMDAVPFLLCLFAPRTATRKSVLGPRHVFNRRPRLAFLAPTTEMASAAGALTV
jgi:hypothetical protein